jgi:hypothetical protein
MPRPLKTPETRQRTNKTTTTAVLTFGVRKAPSLPKEIEWLAYTRQWWRRIWRSPMSSQWLEADTDVLYRLARLVDSFWSAPDPKIAAEIRQIEARFGLAPLDRMRLQWKIETEEPKAAMETTEEEEDPRLGLRLVQ